MDAREPFPLPVEAGDAWLAKAVAHLLAACEAPASALDDPSTLASHPLGESGRAFLRRLDESRLCILCSSLAAEAGINAYLHAKRPGYRGILDKLSPPEKVALAPRLLSGVDPFPPGSRVYEHLVRLHALRAELVNVWPHATGPGDPVDGGLGERFGPRVARELLEATAQSLKGLGELYEHPHRHAVAVALRAAEVLARRIDAVAAMPVPTLAELEDEEERLATGFAEELIGA